MCMCVCMWCGVVLKVVLVVSVDDMNVFEKLDDSKKTKAIPFIK